MKNLIIAALLVLALVSCSKDREGCTWSCQNGDYYEANDYSQAEAERISKCKCELVCPN